MKVRYSFSSRRNRRTENMTKQKSKFPKLLLKIIEDSDIILEILDARFIKDTRNKEIEKLIEKTNKKIIYVLNKADMISKIKIINSNPPKPYIILSATKRVGGKELRNKIKFYANKIKKQEGEKIIVGVIGYPNTGKSSIINLLIGKTSAKTGAQAGFTKGIQKLKLSNEITLLDSPGVIPEEEYSTTQHEKLSKHIKVNARDYSKVRDPEIIVADLIKEMPNIFEKHFKIKSRGNSEILLEKLGKRKNFKKKANEIDFDKTSRFILKEWQEGKIKV